MRFYYLTAGLALLCFLSGSCSSGSDDQKCSSSELSKRDQDLQAAQNVSINAQLAHAQDPSAENCLAYKNAYNIYLEKFILWINCLDISTQEQWRPVYEQAILKLQDIPC